MRIAIVGTGYVGLVSAACFAELGHEVIGVDIDEEKIRKLKQGKSPIYEPELENLIKSGIKSNRLSFTADLKEALPHISILFSAVATPPGDGFEADLRNVFIVAETVAENIDHDLIFVNKSTVPVGTGAECEKRIAALLRKRGVSCHVPVVSNPEFLREGMAVPDTMMPDRIIVGINGVSQSSKLKAQSSMEELYRPITRVGKPLIFMSRESAEIVKYASNAFLATKISFINMLTELTEKTGANIRDVALGIGLDNRIGPKFLHAGIGYGGSCFPKDVKALIATGKNFGIPMSIIEATDAVNKHQRERFIEKILSALPKNAIVAVWGLSFKPKTDDMREAPSIDVIWALRKAGHIFQVFDPYAEENARPLLPQQSVDSNPIAYFHYPIAAVRGADALVVLTEWDEFRGVDLKEVKKEMRGNLLFDGRNVYEPKEVAEAGLEYHGIGMPL